MNIGIIFAALTILFFGSWAVPTKTLKEHPEVQAFWLTIGHFLLSVSIFLFVAQPIPFGELVPPFIAGVLWGIGIISGYIGIRHLGITRALGIWIPLVILTSAFWGLVFFKEAWTLPLQKLILTIAGIALLVIAALAVIFSAKDDKKLGNIKIGITASIILGLIHGSYFIPLRASSVSIFVTFLPLTIGMVVATSFTVIIKKLRVISDMKSVSRMLFAGLIIGGGNYTAILTTQFLGVAGGYPLTQLGIVVNTLWGALIFKEIEHKKGKILIAIGVAVAIVGAVVLNSAK